MVKLILSLIATCQASWFAPNNSIERGAITPPVSVALGAPIIYSFNAPTPIPSVEYVSKGGKVMVFLQGINSDDFGSGSVRTQVSGGRSFGSIAFTRDGVKLKTDSSIYGPDAGSLTSFAPCSSFRMIDSPPVGTVQYNIVPTYDIITSAGSQNFLITNCRIVVVEI